MADEPILIDGWEVLKGNVRCPLCEGSGRGETLAKRGDVYEVVEGGCLGCDGTGWTTVQRFRQNYWGEYMLLVSSWTPGRSPTDKIIDRLLSRWQEAMRGMRGRD